MFNNVYLPDSTTSDTFLSMTSAIFPKMEKITNPTTNDVSEQDEAILTEYLARKRDVITKKPVLHMYTTHHTDQISSRLPAQSIFQQNSPFYIVNLNIHSKQNYTI